MGSASHSAGESLHRAERLWWRHQKWHVLRGTEPNDFFSYLGKKKKIKMAPRKQKRFVERNVKVLRFGSSVSLDTSESPNTTKMKLIKDKRIFIHIDNNGSLRNNSRLMTSVSRAWISMCLFVLSNSHEVCGSILYPWSITTVCSGCFFGSLRHGPVQRKWPKIQCWRMKSGRKPQTINKLKMTYFTFKRNFLISHNILKHLNKGLIKVIN